MNKKKDLNILVVDDETSIRKIMKKIIEFYGYNVDTAGNVDEALFLLEKKAYQIMFLDLNMPKMTGEEFIKEYRKKFPELYIIVMSVYYDKPQYIQDYVEKNSYAILKKPFDFDDIYKIIKQIEGEINGQ